MPTYTTNTIKSVKTSYVPILIRRTEKVVETSCNFQQILVGNNNMYTRKDVDSEERLYI